MSRTSSVENDPVAHVPPTDSANSLSLSLAVLVAVAALPLVIYALEQAELQRIDISSEHAEFNHWVETSFYAVAVLLLGLVAAWRPVANRLTAWCAGLGLRGLRPMVSRSRWSLWSEESILSIAFRGSILSIGSVSNREGWCCELHDSN